MAEQIYCSNCGEKLGVLKNKVYLINENGEEKNFCKKCYDDIPKEEKIKYQVAKKKSTTDKSVYVVGLAFGAAYNDGFKNQLNNDIKGYNLSFDKINKFAIENYNTHFWLCDNTFKSASIGLVKKEEKNRLLNDIASKNFNKNFENCDRKEKKIVKKELKLIIKTNLEKNKEKNLL